MLSFKIGLHFRLKPKESWNLKGKNSKFLVQKTIKQTKKKNPNNKKKLNSAAKLLIFPSKNDFHEKNRDSAIKIEFECNLWKDVSETLSFVW